MMMCLSRPRRIGAKFKEGEGAQVTYHIICEWGDGQVDLCGGPQVIRGSHLAIHMLYQEGGVQPHSGQHLNRSLVCHPGGEPPPPLQAGSR